MQQDFQRRLRVLAWLLHGSGVLVMIVVACVCHYALVAEWRQQQINDLRDSQNLQIELRAAQQIRQEHTRLTDQLLQLESRAAAMRNRIPEEPLDDEFLSQVSRAADTVGLRLRDFTPGSRSTTQTHSEMRIRLQADGSFTAICGFVSQLSELPRVATVDELRISSGDDTGIYPFDMTLILYFGVQQRETQG